MYFSNSCQENHAKEIEFLDKLGPSMSELASSFVKEMLDHLAANQQVDKVRREIDEDDTIELFLSFTQSDSDVQEVKKEDAFQELLNAIKTKKDSSRLVSRDEQEENKDSDENISEAISNETEEEATILSCYAKDYEDLVETKVDDVVAAKTGLTFVITYLLYLSITSFC